jgi:hypothetical protein
MLYTLELRDGSNWIEDEVVLPDRERAFEYARTVVRELMRCREQQTRTWRLCVYQDKGVRVFEIPFARFDETLSHLSPKGRETIVDLCDRRRTLERGHWHGRGHHARIPGIGSALTRQALPGRRIRAADDQGRVAASLASAKGKDQLTTATTGIALAIWSRPILLR